MLIDIKTLSPVTFFLPGRVKRAWGWEVLNYIIDDSCKSTLKLDLEYLR